MEFFNSEIRNEWFFVQFGHKLHTFILQTNRTPFQLICKINESIELNGVSKLLGKEISDNITWVCIDELGLRHAENLKKLFLSHTCGKMM